MYSGRSVDSQTWLRCCSESTSLPEQRHVIAIVNTFHGTRRRSTECSSDIAQNRNNGRRNLTEFAMVVAGGGEEVGESAVRTDLHRKVDCHAE
jgi:hypothetical protein